VAVVVAQRRAIQEHEIAARERAAVVVIREIHRLPDAGRIALELARVTAGRGVRRRGRVVDVEARAVAAPGRRDRRPVVARVAHLLVAVREAHAGLERAQPAAAAQVVLHVGLRGDLVGVVVLPVILDELHPVVVRVREEAVGIVDVRTG
jgi:hypothetical protein